MKLVLLNIVMDNTGKVNTNNKSAMARLQIKTDKS